jgi:TP901 family phage tail tape measure protein
MPDKSVTVKLQASVAQYLASMATASKATSGFRGSLMTLGAGMTKFVTLPVLGAAGASVKMALDYETAFTKIGAISNATQQQVAGWKDEVLGMAGETAQAPRELADALFFLASAGLDAEQIMPTLEASAKAAASGLGETADIARLTANVLNAYAGTGLTAARATDVLVAAVKEGTAEPEEFATAMGRILPIAARSKVSFDAIAASMAAMSNIGLDVSEATTALRGALQAMIAPGTQAKEVMEEAGVSAQDLLDSFEQDGLIAAVRLLEEGIRGISDTEAEFINNMRMAIPNVRALTGLFALTGQEAAKVDAIFKNVTNSTGEAGRVFAETARGPGFQMDQALARIQSTAIRVGQQLLPVVTDIARKVGDLIGGFGNLDPALQANIVKWGLLAAAAGPALMIFSKLIGVVAGLLTPLGALKLGAIGVAYGIGRIVQGNMELDASFDTLTDAVRSGDANMSDLLERAEHLEEALKGVSGETLGMSGAVLGLLDPTGKAEERIRLLVREITAFTEDVNRLPGALNESRLGMIRNYVSTGNYAEAIKWLTHFQNLWLENAIAAQGAGHDLATEIDRLTAASERAAEARRADARETRMHNRNMNELETSIRRVPKEVRTKVDADTKPGTAKVKTYTGWVDRQRAEVGVGADTSSAFASVQHLLNFVASVQARINLGLGGSSVPHAGGTVGQSMPRRLHQGTQLRGDEMGPFILQKGERVLSRAELGTLRGILGGSMTPTGNGKVAAPTIINMGDVTIETDDAEGVVSGLETIARSSLNRRGL